MGDLVYTDIQPAAWRDIPAEEMRTLWQFSKRDTSGGHALGGKYHGNFVPQVPRRLLQRYTKEGDLVADPFCGSGTTLVECIRARRRSVGWDINPKAVKLSDEATEIEIQANPDSNMEYLPHLSVGDAGVIAHWRSRLEDMGADAFDFIILHPPYADIVKFSDYKRDLSNMDLMEFEEKFGRVARTAVHHLRPGRFLALVIGDVYKNSQHVPLGFECMERLRKYDMKLKSIIVKDMQGNERGSGGKNENLWRRRALQGGFSVFAHEYVFVMQRGG